MSQKVLLTSYIRNYLNEIEEQKILELLYVELLENNELNEGIPEIVNSIKNFTKSTSKLERFLLTGIVAGLLGISVQSLGINDSSGVLDNIANRTEINTKNDSKENKKEILYRTRKELSRNNIEGIAALLGITQKEAEFLAQGGNPLPELFKALLKNKTGKGPIASYEDNIEDEDGSIRLADKFLNTQAELQEYLNNPGGFSEDYNSPKLRIFQKLKKVTSIERDDLYKILNNNENSEDLYNSSQDLSRFLKYFIEKTDELYSLEAEYNENPDSKETLEKYSEAWSTHNAVLTEFCKYLDVDFQAINSGLRGAYKIELLKTLILDNMW